MRAKRVLAGAAAGMTAMAFVGGCAAQQIKRLEPKLELRAAAQHLAAEKQAGFTLRLTGSADDLLAGLRRQAAADGEKGPDAEDTKALRTVFDSSFTMAYDAAGDGPDDDRVSLAATVGGVAGTEIRVVDKIVYAKAPITALAQKFGASAADVAATRAEATAETPQLGAFFDGGWVAVDVAQAAKSGGLPAEDADAEKALAELRKSATNLFDGADIVRDPADDEHLIVTSSTAKAYAEVKRLVGAVGGATGLAEEMGKPPTDRPIVLDLWIEKEKLTAVEVNVLQFIDGATGRAAVRLEVTTGAPIAVPEGATKIDLGGMMPYVEDPTGGDGPTPGADALGLAEKIGYEAQMYAEESGGKPTAHLREAIDGMADFAVTGRVVRRGVAEIKVAGTTACVRITDDLDREPVVTKGGC